MESRQTPPGGTQPQPCLAHGQQPAPRCLPAPRQPQGQQSRAPLSRHSSGVVLGMPEGCGAEHGSPTGRSSGGHRGSPVHGSVRGEGGGSAQAPGPARRRPAREPWVVRCHGCLRHSGPLTGVGRGPISGGTSSQPTAPLRQPHGKGCDHRSLAGRHWGPTGLSRAPRAAALPPQGLLPPLSPNSLPRPVPAAPPLLPHSLHPIPRNRALGLLGSVQRCQGPHRRCPRPGRHTEPLLSTAPSAPPGTGTATQGQSHGCAQKS